MYDEIIIKALGALLSGLILLVLSRWATKLTKALDAQLVINAEAAGALRLITEKLTSHRELSEDRNDDIRERLERLERDVAHRAGRA